MSWFLREGETRTDLKSIAINSGAKIDYLLIEKNLQKG